MANMFNEDGTYNKTEWKAGDKITAVKLNKIESSLEAINNNDIDRHVEADSRLDALEERMNNTPDNKQMDALEDMVKDNKDAADLAVYGINQKIESLESVNADGRLDALEDVNADTRLDALECVNADGRLDALEYTMGNLEIINVRDFGALGYGMESSEVDQEAFERAIATIKSINSPDDSETGKCELYIPNGRYFVGGLDIPCGTKVRGCGMWNTILAHTRGEYLFQVVGEFNHPATMFSELNIRGGYHESSGHALKFKNKTAINIRDCWLSANKSIIIEGTFDNIITGCVFDVGSVGIDIIGGGNTIVSNSIFWGLKTYAIRANNAKNISINNNEFSSNIIDNIRVENSNNVHISNNMFIGSNGAVNNAGYNVMISNSHIFNITNNTMSNCKSTGIGILNSSYLGKVLNNSIVMSETNQANGIFMTSGIDIDVMYNLIKNAGYYSLLSRCDNVRMVGNKIDSLLDHSTKPYNDGGSAITISGANNVLNDNIVSSNGKFAFALFVNSGVAVTLRGNNFGESTDYSNPYNSTTTTSGAVVVIEDYVSPKHFATTGTTDLTGLTNHVNSLISTLIEAGVLKS